MTIEILKELFFGKGNCDSYHKTKKPITKLKWILNQVEKEKIQFAIEVLEDFIKGDYSINDKIQELKQYLDEKNNSNTIR